MAIGIPEGTVLKSELGIDIKVGKLLGEGGQGMVYLVEYAGKQKAMKVYKHGKILKPKDFIENLKNNIQNGAPSKHFLWPEDMLPWNGKTCGYIMDLRPQNFNELTDFTNSHKPDVKFSSFTTAATACLQIVDAFRILHSKGYSYQDINAGNFFIDKNTGAVLICDNDNVSEAGYNSGILGTPEYMAPEIVRGECKPDKYTDYFSLSVVLFLILTMTHPLEGSRFLVENLSPALEKIIFGTEPIFILDPEDHRNAPVKGIHNSIVVVWPEMPTYLRSFFTKAFCKEYLTDTSKRQRRPAEGEWMDVLMRFRSDIIRCPACKDENFGFDPNQPVCRACKKAALPVKKYLKTDGVNYLIPVVPGKIVYRKQVGPSAIDVAGRPVLYVTYSPNKDIVIQNYSGETLTLIKEDKSRADFKYGAMAAAIKGRKIIVEGNEIEIL